jgi:hypothetical protein
VCAPPQLVSWKKLIAFMLAISRLMDLCTLRTRRQFEDAARF